MTFGLIKSAHAGTRAIACTRVSPAPVDQSVEAIGKPLPLPHPRDRLAVWWWQADGQLGRGPFVGFANLKNRSRGFVRPLPDAFLDSDTVVIAVDFSSGFVGEVAEDLSTRWTESLEMWS
jgi:hypothetical protein